MQEVVRSLCVLLACALLLAAPGAQAYAAGAAAKQALVIGNSRYGGGHALLNTGNDARLMAGTLATLGFQVTERHDLNRSQLDAAVSAFAAGLPAGATALVYYAGHGMQLEGGNYLTPVDMPLTSMASAKLRSYALNTLLDRLGKAKSAINVVVLDACRDNPFQPGAAVRYRSFRNIGLSPLSAPRGTLIAYSTLPGQQAPDGSGANSVYTATLARMLAQPGVELETVFKRVGNEVRRQSRDDQIPWYETSLAGAYYLHALDGTKNGIALPAKGSASPRAQATRGMALQPWYRQLSAHEASQLDREIQQRVMRMTPDELPLLRHQASGGSVVAQTVLGLAYRDGDVRKGFKPNNGAAWTWLNKAAQAGFPMAQAEVGEMYHQAHGVERDPARSRYWLEQAASTGYPRAKLDLLQLQGTAAPDEAELRDAARAVFESLRLPSGRKD